ncbi:hypothetical protein [Ramlibacter albus]|uniref:Uncharacterized protein n=1 Tax=Ramlibacter albus TaxID=2079448 RepID=A0A923S213_9BURK|nr:hypothetical protein [Ramlibacter albus]MBC5764856.1 hypothetical protein [Ramlibacter albus]
MKKIASLAAIALCAALNAAPAFADAGSLRAKYTELTEQLRNNNYGRALYIDSTEGSNTLQGDVYAVLDHPFSKVSQALKQPSQWCDVMILPFNTKYCHAMGPNSMQVRIGRKFDQPVEQAYRLDFNYQNVAASNDYFESRLNAAQGPVGTKNYRINVEAVPLDSGKTFMHMTYSYGYGGMGKMAMQAYLSTAGASKIGFSQAKDEATGKMGPIGGVRGAIERNAMRYYLAIDAYLDSLDAPREQQAEKRIQQWFSATERYPRQLHEMDRSTYVAMKRQEVERQQTALLQ